MMCTYSAADSHFHDRRPWQIAEDDDDTVFGFDRPRRATMAIDVERISAREPEVVHLRRSLAGSFQQWLNQTFIEEEAARTIQAFLRAKFQPMVMNKNGISYGTSSTFSISSEDGDSEVNDDHEHYEVFLWHGTVLGLEFYSCDLTGLPCVEDGNGNDSLPGMWNLRAGDFLVSINDCSVHCDSIDFDSVMQILDDGVRPAILRFRKPRMHEMRIRPSHTRKAISRSMSAAKKDQQRRRERLERSLCYVVWREEDGPLGIVLKPDRSKPYPSVSEVNEFGVVARESQRNRVRAGDLLLSINHMDVSAMGYRKSLDIMKFAPRPLVLTFRRTAPEYSTARSLEL